LIDFRVVVNYGVVGGVLLFLFLMAYKIIFGDGDD
jgi:hypothetical protein